MAKKKYTLEARRNDRESWTSWLVTNDDSVIKRNVVAIRRYGWQYRLNKGKLTVKPA